MAKIGRPKIKITPEQWKIAENMATIHCTGEEMVYNDMGAKYYGARK